MTARPTPRNAPPRNAFGHTALLRGLALGLGLPLAALHAAHAESDKGPFYLGASLALSHVSNVYRLPEANVPNSDDVVTGSLLAGLDKPFGRQRFFADAAWRDNRYHRERSLDHTGYTLNAGMDWAALDKLAGRLLMRSTRNLAQYNLSSEVNPLRAKNLERNELLEASARYGLAGKLSLEGGLAHQTRDFSAESYRVLNFKQDSAFAGLGWRSSGALRFGLTGRHTEGNGYARVLVFVLPNDYRRQDLELSSEWTASAASTLNARLGVSRIDNSNSGIDNFSGLTGRLEWQWAPSGRLKLNTAIARDTVQENYFKGGNSLGAEVNRVTNSLQLGISYALAAKLQVDAGLNASRMDRSDNGAANERSQGFNIGLRWQPTRHSQLGCQYNREQRRSEIATLNYSASSSSCYGQLTLR
ncbi:MAG: hypothetical protein C0423_05645 [Methylibium sp.]|nr:hypothetical protein [Methylibium sp.]